MLDLPKDNSAKIVRQALNFESPDRLPVFDNFWEGFIDNWRKTYSLNYDTDIEDYYWIDLKVPVAREEFFPTEMCEIKRDDKGIYVNDGWGRVVRVRPGTYFSETIERILNNSSDLDKIRFDTPVLDMRYESFLREVKFHRDKGRAVFVKIGGPFIRCSFLRGEAEFLMDMAIDENFAKAQVEKVGEHLLQVGLESLKRSRTYEFGVWIYDDMCNTNGPMFSPQTFEKLFLPIYKHMVSTFKAAGAKWVILHCDGNLRPILNMLIEAGIDGINPVEYNAGLNVVELIEKYYGKLRFIGGVCNTHILSGGDIDCIRKHVEAIVKAGRSGGLIIGTHSVGQDISIENYELYRKIVANNQLVSGI